MVKLTRAQHIELAKKFNQVDELLDEISNVMVEVKGVRAIDNTLYIMSLIQWRLILPMINEWTTDKAVLDNNDCPYPMTGHGWPGGGVPKKIRGVVK